MKKNIDTKTDQIKELSLRIDAVEDEKLLIENQLKKALADYTNLQRDIDKRIEIKSIQMKLQIANTLLNVLDDISLAMQAKEGMQVSEEMKAWIEGIEATVMDMNKALLELGIEKIEVNVGDIFNSSIHEALTVSDQGKKNEIVQVIQPGFKIGEIVIRPARVIVGNK